MREEGLLSLPYIETSVRTQCLGVLFLPRLTDECERTDCSYSISTQLFGRKLWYLFPPSCTPCLSPLIQFANHTGEGVNCHEWTEERKGEFRERGMLEVYQEQAETIFVYVYSCSEQTPYKTDQMKGIDTVPQDGFIQFTISLIPLSRSIIIGATLTICPRSILRYRKKLSDVGKRSVMSRSC